MDSLPGNLRLNYIFIAAFIGNRSQRMAAVRQTLSGGWIKKIQVFLAEIKIDRQTGAVTPRNGYARHNENVAVTHTDPSLVTEIFNYGDLTRDRAGSRGLADADPPGTTTKL